MSGRLKTQKSGRAQGSQKFMEIRSSFHRQRLVDSPVVAATEDLKQVAGYKYQEWGGRGGAEERWSSERARYRKRKPKKFILHNSRGTNIWIGDIA